LELIENKPNGLLFIMEEEVRFPKANDESLLDKMHKSHEKTKRHVHVCLFVYACLFYLCLFIYYQRKLLDKTHKSHEKQKGCFCFSVMFVIMSIYLFFSFFSPLFFVFSYSKPRTASQAFIIEHYAGKVTYEIAGFLGLYLFIYLSICLFIIYLFILFKTKNREKQIHITTRFNCFMPKFKKSLCCFFIGRKRRRYVILKHQKSKQTK
jgi:hypothetical protein